MRRQPADRRRRRRRAPERGRSRMSPAQRRVALRVGLVALLLGLWQLCASLKLWNALLFPPPSDVWGAFWSGVRDRSIVLATVASLQRLAIGYGISLAIGVPLGLLLGQVRWLDETVGSLALGLQALPSICWLPLAVLWFGLSETAIQFVVVMGSLMAVTLATRDGVNVIPPIYMRA